MAPPRPRSTYALAARVAMVLLCVLHPRAAAPAELLPREYELKAAFLYNAMKFVQWPLVADGGGGERESPLLLCVVGEDPFRNSLDLAMADRSVQGREVSIKRFNPSAGASEIVPCNVLFVSASESDRAATLLGALSAAPVFTVADWKGFAESGGVLELMVVGNKLAFVVNQGAAETHGLKISSQLLKLATTVLK